MVMKQGKALMAYEDDIKKRNIMDWIKAHTSFARPLHRYDGELELWDEKIVFRGKDTKTKDNYSLDVGRKEITDVHLGFDDVFKRMEDRSVGISFLPLRIRFSKGGYEQCMYLIMDFRRASRRTTNKEWYELIQKWMD